MTNLGDDSVLFCIRICVIVVVWKASSDSAIGFIYQYHFNDISKLKNNKYITYSLLQKETSIDINYEVL